MGSGSNDFVTLLSCGSREKTTPEVASLCIGEVISYSSWLNSGGLLGLAATAEINVEQ